MHILKRTAVYLTGIWYVRLLFFCCLLFLAYELVNIPDYNFPPLASAFVTLIILLLPSLFVEAIRQNSKMLYLGFFVDRITLNNLLTITIVSIITLTLYTVIFLIFGVKPVLTLDSAGIFSVVVILLINAFSEELLFRGVIFQSMLEGLGEITATLVISLLFAALHLLNPYANVLSFINTFLFSLLLCFIFIRTYSLLAVTLLHFFWNAFQVLILGWNISGFSYNSSIFYFPSETLPVWLSGGSYGIEATVVLTIMILLQGILFIKFLKNSPFVSSLILKRNFSK